MEHEPVRGITFFVSLPEGGDNQFCIRTDRDVPGNDFSGVQVHHNAEIVPFPARSDVGGVTGPYEIGCFLVKVLLQVVGAGIVIGTSGCDRGLVCGHFGKP